MGFPAPILKPDKATELRGQREDDRWDLLAFQSSGKSEEPFLFFRFNENISLKG